MSTYKFDLGREGQAMTAPQTTAAYTAFSGMPTYFNAIRIQVLGSHGAYVVATNPTDALVADATHSHYIAAGAYSDFIKPDDALGVSLLSAGAGTSALVVHFGRND